MVTASRQKKRASLAHIPMHGIPARIDAHRVLAIRPGMAVHKVGVNVPHFNRTIRMMKR